MKHIAFTSVVVLLSICYLNAQPGALDTTFNLTGKVITDFGSLYDQ